MSNDLHEELLVEIFNRLPTKSLLRFRAVSKSLCTSIGSPGFIRLHTLRSPNKVIIIHQIPIEPGAPCFDDVYTLYSGGQLSENPNIGITPINYPFKSFNTIGSCNGIVCIYEYDNENPRIRLWNPSIRRSVMLHDPPSWSDCEGQEFQVLVGIGFDPIVDDYKVLIVTRKGEVQSTFVYTMKTRTWREIASPTTTYANTTPCQCLFNGALHWTVNTGSGEDCHYYILAFDLSSEVFSTIELPEPSWETFDATIIKSSLAVMSSNLDGDIWIWVRREYNDSTNTAASWSVAFKLNRYHFMGVHHVLQITPNGDLMFNYGQEMIIVYNPESGADSRFAGITDAYVELMMTPCVESLELLDMGTSCDQGTRNICEELLAEIFTRLPTKSLLRFRSVSKSLCACIGSPAFIRLHALRSPNKVMILHKFPLEDEEGPYGYEEVYALHSDNHDPYIGLTPVYYPFSSFDAVGSCNGIVCVYVYEKPRIRLWNPAIRRSVAVDDPPCWGDRSPSIQVLIGFGFDPIVDDYKVLNITRKGDVQSTFVYTMKTHTWREIASPSTIYAYKTSCQCLFNGVLHWIVSTGSGDACRYCILAFDLSSEVFSTIELPEPSRHIYEVTIIKSSLAVMSSHLDHDENWIWVRKEYYNNTAASWSVAFKMNTSPLIGVDRVLQITPNGDLLLNSFSNGVVYYNLATGNKYRRVCFRGSSDQVLMTPCVESLELLDMGTSCDRGTRQI